MGTSLVTVPWSYAG